MDKCIQDLNSLISTIASLQPVSCTNQILHRDNSHIVVCPLSEGLGRFTQPYSVLQVVLRRRHRHQVRRPLIDTRAPLPLLHALTEPPHMTFPTCLRASLSLYLQRAAHQTTRTAARVRTPRPRELCTRLVCRARVPELIPLSALLSSQSDVQSSIQSSTGLPL